MAAFPDVLELTRQLLAFNTVNPPGNEAACTQHIGQTLTQAGFSVAYHEMAPGRTNLVARYGATDAARSICFVGHTDTVPLGVAPWRHTPFAGEVVDGRLYGRGASDMKSGIAAFVTAAIRARERLADDAAIVLLIAAGEETGCEGSAHLASLGLSLGRFTGVIVGEPTDNMPLVGHKGALWLEAGVRGVAAHGAMPDSGINAIRKGAELVLRLDDFCRCRAPHRVLGQPTLNVGTFRAGENVNSVPDWAEIGLDIRTVPGMEHEGLRQELSALLAPQLDALRVRSSMPHVWTPPDHPWVQRVFAIVEQATGDVPTEQAAPYFTDASALQPVIAGAPTLVLGPGTAAAMHQTDEYCEIAKLHVGVAIYEAILLDTLAAPAGQPGAALPVEA